MGGCERRFLRPSVNFFVSQFCWVSAASVLSAAKGPVRGSGLMYHLFLRNSPLRVHGHGR